MTFQTDWSTGDTVVITVDGVTIADPAQTLVKLTVIHDGFADDSLVLKSISTGWPQVLASLKTLLETGEVLPTGPAVRRRNLEGGQS